MKSNLSFMTGNVLVLTVCRIIFTMSQSLAGPYFSLFVLALGGSAQDIGIVTALGGLAGLILYPLGGYVADMKGRVKLIGFSTFAFAASYILYVVAWNWQLLAIAQFVQNLVLFYMPAINAIMADSIPARMRGVGYATTIAIPGAVGIVIPYLGGFLIDKVFGGDIIPAMRLSYAISGLLGLLVAFIRLKWLKETMNTSNKEGISITQIPSLLRESYQSVIETIKWFPQTLKYVAIIQMVTTFFVGLTGPFWIVYATTIVGLTPYDWGVLMLMAGAFSIALSIPMGRLIDHFGPRKTILATSFIPPVVTFLFPFCRSFPTVLGILLFLTVFNAATSPAYSTLMVGHIPSNRRGRVFSILGQGVGVTYGGVNMGAVLLFIPGTIGAAIGGFIYGYNSQFPWYILSVALAGCTYVTWKFIKDPAKM
jgi:MFS family permease